MQLVEITERHRRLFERGPANLVEALGLTLPSGWPEYPKIFLARIDPEWPFYLFVDRDQAMVVGSGGFTCSPDARGEVQIGYEIAPAFRRQGIATHMMRMVLARHPLARPIAFTSADFGPSASVLRKLGFSSTGCHRLEDDVTVWRWSRPSHV